MSTERNASDASAGPRQHRRDGSPWRLGVMGGTFDPIHHGHLVAASEVASVFDLDEVVFVPTGEPWQKVDKDVSEAEHRYLMTVIATASNPTFTVSRVDIERPGPTFTIDTLRDLKQQRPAAQLFFITGADAMAQILTWKDAEELWSLAQFIGVTRPGHELDGRGRDVRLLEVPAMAISSTDCRRRVGEGKPVWYLVPDGVVQYISKYRLYRRPGRIDDGLSSGLVGDEVFPTDGRPGIPASPERQPTG